MFYGRSSSCTQESGLATQVERAKALGIDDAHIFAELVSGKSKDNRPKQGEMLRFVRKCDTLVVTKLDRLGRSAADLHAIAQQLQKKGGICVCLISQSTRAPALAAPCSV